MFYTAPTLAQSAIGELRLKVTDPAGLALKAAVDLSNDGAQFRHQYETGNTGALTVRNLPFGLYQIRVEHEGFAPYQGLLEIRSVIPLEYLIQLSVASASTAINVTAQRMLLDPDSTTAINRIDSREISDRASALPGRSLPDLVSAQPGWVYEGSAVLHPRGSEYQTQFVVDGVPLTDNRSPSNGPEIEADDVESLTIYTAGIPAEYGRKMGGVVEVDTTKETRSGLHGKVVLSGGSFGTANGYVLTQYGWGKNTASVSADAAMTDRYLNPPVVENYTNTGSTSDFAGRYDRDFTNHDRMGITIRRETSKFLVPNEQLQQAAEQLQHRRIFESLGILSYQHIFSEHLLADLRAMVRSNTDALESKAKATPVMAFQDRGFTEQYFKGTVSYHHGRHEIKVGFEADFSHLRESFNDILTCDPESDLFCPFEVGTPAAFSFSERGLDLEQSAFAQDLIRLDKWTASAGLRWDHYQLRVNENAVSPRLGVARYFPSAKLVLHASYDRVFQTPAFENVLLASSTAVASLNPQVLRLPVRPSHGNYYEVGVTEAFSDQWKLDVNVFRRTVNNFADDDQLLNTSVSFPIALRKGNIYGAESKLELPQWRRFSGFVSYSYMIGSVYLPVTGGFLLGTDINNALTHNRLWDSQDQRHTLHGRVRYQMTSRAWVAFSGAYGSGLPTDFDGTPADASLQYGPSIVDRVDFARGRVKPNLSLDVSGSVTLWQHDQTSLRLSAAVQNLNDRLNLIDFAGLFSGNAVAPPRSYSLRLQAMF